MSHRLHFLLRCAMVAALCTASAWGQQVTSTDYERAAQVREKYRGLALDIPDAPIWVKGTAKFYYRKSVQGGYAFQMVDAQTATKQPAFDHEKLAAVLSQVSGDKYTAVTLPFQRYRFSDAANTIELALNDAQWSCDLVKYTCTNQGPLRPGFPRGARGGDAGGAPD